MKTFAPILVSTLGYDFQPSSPRIVGFGFDHCHAVTYDAQVGLLLALCWNDASRPGALLGIDPASGSVKFTLSLGAAGEELRDVLVGPSESGTRNWWVTNQKAGKIYKISPNAKAPSVIWTITGLSLPTYTCASWSNVFVSSDTSILYKIDPTIDPGSGNPIAGQISVGSTPLFSDFDPANNLIWVPCYGTGDIWRINHDAMTEFDHWGAGSFTNPYMVRINGDKAWITENGPNNSILWQSIDGTAAQRYSVFGSGAGAAGMAIGNGKIVVCLSTSGGKGSVGFVDMSTGLYYGAQSVYAPETGAGHPATCVLLANGDIWVALANPPARLQLFRDRTSF